MFSPAGKKLFRTFNLWGSILFALFFVAYWARTVQLYNEMNISYQMEVWISAGTALLTLLCAGIMYKKGERLLYYFIVEALLMGVSFAFILIPAWRVIWNMG